VLRVIGRTSPSFAKFLEALPTSAAAFPSLKALSVAAPFFIGRRGAAEPVPTPRSFLQVLSLHVPVLEELFISYPTLAKYDDHVCVISSLGVGCC
jgi:hypothetical protein